jgi:hypothetical protein
MWVKGIEGIGGRNIIDKISEAGRERKLLFCIIMTQTCLMRGKSLTPIKGI